VLGTAVLGTMITAFYRANVTVPSGLTPGQSSAAGETISGAAAVAQEVPAVVAEELMGSARQAFDSGIGWLSISCVVLSLGAAAIVVMGFSKRHAPSEQESAPMRVSE
jgi:DHA2 family multidrug resistance protein-like MFS transporter